MSLTILESRPATASEWDDIWKNCDYATYFHSREWAEIWQKYTNGKINPSGNLLTFSDNTTALLPFSYRKILFFKQYFSSPAGTFGGWLSLDKLSENHGNLLHEYIVANHQNLIWRLNPYDPLSTHLKIEDAKEDATLVLNLESGFDVIYKGWTKGHSSAVHKARKDGVVIRLADCQQDWEIYFDIYGDSIRRWGNRVSSMYGYALFEGISKLSSPNIKLWLAIYENKIIAGAICLYAKAHVVYWHGAALEKYFGHRPVNLLMYEAIKNACEGGYLWFDFNPSGGHEGVEKFKRSFGTSKIACPTVVRNNAAIKKIFNVRKLLSRL